MTSDRSIIEKIVEQELSGVLLQSIKVAHQEERQEVEDVLKMILKVIDARRSEREKARLA